MPPSLSTRGRGEDPISYQFLNRIFRVTPPGMQFGCVFIIFGSDTYRKSIPNTKFRICRRSRTSEHKVGFSRCAVQFHYILLHMSRSIKIGLFELLNSVWLIHCLKSHIAMTELTGRYVVLIVSHFKFFFS